MVRQASSPSHIAARVIPAIGRPDFPAQLLSAYRELADCDLCSAFVWRSHGPQLLFAAGTQPQATDFAVSASRAYEQRYWQFDPTIGRRSNGLSVLRTSETDIRNSDYRRDCYQSGGICERLTLFDTDGPAVSVSGYRTVGCAPTTAQTVIRMEDAAPTLVAALRRHQELTERAAQVLVSPSRNALLQWARQCGLSEREAEVAASLATGQSQSDIASRCGLALNSVITYRRRAYQKLKVADRRELKALCERLVDPASP